MALALVGLGSMKSLFWVQQLPRPNETFNITNIEVKTNKKNILSS